jgi:hypothetical protein
MEFKEYFITSLRDNSYPELARVVGFGGLIAVSIPVVAFDVDMRDLLAIIC